MCYGFLPSILHIILHGLPFVFCFLFLFYCYMVFILWGLWVLFGGGSYSAVYVPPPLCLFPVVLIMYIPPFFLSCFVYLFLLSHMPLVVLFSPCVCFICAWMKTFGRCMHMHHMQLCMSLEICMLNILCYNLISLARIVMLSM